LCKLDCGFISFNLASHILIEDSNIIAIELTLGLLLCCLDSLYSPVIKQSLIHVSHIT